MNNYKLFIYNNFGDLMLIILSIPLVFVPLLFAFKIFSFNEALVVWISFFFSTLTYSLTKIASAGIFILLFSFSVISFAIFHDKKMSKRKIKGKKYIVLGFDDKNSSIILFDGSIITNKITLCDDDFYVGDIVKID